MHYYAYIIFLPVGNILYSNTKYHPFTEWKCIKIKIICTHSFQIEHSYTKFTKSKCLSEQLTKFLHMLEVKCSHKFLLSLLIHKINQIPKVHNCYCLLVLPIHKLVTFLYHIPYNAHLPNKLYRNIELYR